MDNRRKPGLRILRLMAFIFVQLQMNTPGGSLCPPPSACAILVKEVRKRVMDTPLDIILIVVAAVVGIAIGFFTGVAYRKKIAEREIGSAEAEATRLINEAIRRNSRKSRRFCPPGEMRPISAEASRG